MVLRDRCKHLLHIKLRMHNQSIIAPEHYMRDFQSVCVAHGQHSSCSFTSPLFRHIFINGSLHDVGNNIKVCDLGKFLQTQSSDQLIPVTFQEELTCLPAVPLVEHRYAICLVP